MTQSALRPHTCAYCEFIELRCGIEGTLRTLLASPARLSPDRTHSMPGAYRQCQATGVLSYALTLSVAILSYAPTPSIAGWDAPGSPVGHVCDPVTAVHPGQSVKTHCVLSPQAVGDRRVPLEERVADDHVFFWKAVVAEPCYWDSKALLTGAPSAATTPRCAGAWWRRSRAARIGCSTGSASGTSSGRDSAVSSSRANDVPAARLQQRARACFSWTGGQGGGVQE